MRCSAVAALVTIALGLATASACADDIVVQAEGRERGTALLFHHGAWLGGSPAGEQGTATVLSRAGWRAVSVDYPLHDVPASLRYARGEAARYAIPGERLVAVGESSGGTIAEWLAATRRVDAAAAIGAPSDFTSWSIIQPGGAWDGWPGMVDLGDQAWRWSPARMFSRPRSAPLLVYHSIDDEVVGPDQALEMVVRGARAVWLHGSHLADQSWQQTLAPRLARMTTRR